MNRESQLRGPQLAGLILVALGVLFLVGQVFSFNLFRISWPFFIIIPGAAFVALGLSTNRAGSTYLGSVIVTIGLILLYQSIFNHYASWAYAWTLIPAGFGAGQILQGSATHESALVEQGKRLAAVSGVLFSLGWIFFELIIGISGHASPLGGYAGPAVLIGAGAYLIYRQSHSIAKF